MSTLKQLPSKETTPKLSGQMTFSDGLRFSFGFWVGTILLFIVLVPALSCAVVIILSLLGVYVGELIPNR